PRSPRVSTLLPTRRSSDLHQRGAQPAEQERRDDHQEYQETDAEDEEEDEAFHGVPFLVEGRAVTHATKRGWGSAQAELALDPPCDAHGRDGRRIAAQHHPLPVDEALREVPGDAAAEP